MRIELEGKVFLSPKLDSGKVCVALIFLMLGIKSSRVTSCVFRVNEQEIGKISISREFIFVARVVKKSFFLLTSATESNEIGQSNQLEDSRKMKNTNVKAYCLRKFVRQWIINLCKIFLFVLAWTHFELTDQMFSNLNSFIAVNRKMYGNVIISRAFFNWGSSDGWLMVLLKY